MLVLFRQKKSGVDDEMWNYLSLMHTAQWEVMVRVGMEVCTPHFYVGLLPLCVLAIKIVHVLVTGILYILTLPQLG